MKKNKGFTLIELLAVIVILGVLMMVAIPSVTGYIASARKGSFASNAQLLVDSVRSWAVENSVVPSFPGEGYVIPITTGGTCGQAATELTVALESGGTKSAFGKSWLACYNYVIIYKGEAKAAEYYYAGADTAGNIIPLTKYDDISSKSVTQVALGQIDNYIKQINTQTVKSGQSAGVFYTASVANSLVNCYQPDSTGKAPTPTVGTDGAVTDATAQAAANSCPSVGFTYTVKADGTGYDKGSTPKALTIYTISD